MALITSLQYRLKSPPSVLLQEPSISPRLHVQRGLSNCGPVRVQALVTQLRPRSHREKEGLKNIWISKVTDEAGTQPLAELRTSRADRCGPVLFLRQLEMSQAPARPFSFLLQGHLQV